MPKFYDVNIDGYREFTQEDLDQHLLAVRDMGRFIRAIRKALQDWDDAVADRLMKAET